ncbi:MAG TPA: hypothetical protein VIU29_01095, partial [Candidatus Deferrimicrobiaceae bacterium]
MNAFQRSIRVVLAAVAAASFSLAVAACGGGGSSSGTAGQAAVDVSVSSSQGFPANATLASASTAAVDTAAQPAPVFDNILVAVTRIALIPSEGAPDANGELEAVNSPAENGPSGETGFVTVTLPSPVVIDLLHPPTGARIAKLLNKFTGVPAG